MAKAASRPETEKADRAEANRNAALVKQKTKKERDAAVAAAEAAAVAASTKRNHASAFDCSQVSTQQEPPGSQEGPPLAEEPEAKKGKWSKDNKKRKNTADLIREISSEIKKTKAAKITEYQSQLDKRTAGAQTPAATNTSNEPATSSSGMGYSRIDPSHKRCRLNGEIVFCWNCGYWMVKKSQNLQKRCDPDPTKITSHQKSMRDNKLRKGLYPQAKCGKVAQWKDGACTTKPVPIEWLDPP